MQISEELQQKLIEEVGLSKQQASSRTTELLVQYFMADDGKTLILEARQQVAEIRKEVTLLQRKCWQLRNEMENEIESISDTVIAIKEAQEEYGCVTDDRAKNALALYAALFEISKKGGASTKNAIKSASRITCAHLGGQAKRDIHYNDPIDDENLYDNQ